MERRRSDLRALRSLRCREVELDLGLEVALEPRVLRGALPSAEAESDPAALSVESAVSPGRTRLGSIWLGMTSLGTTWLGTDSLGTTLLELLLLSRAGEGAAASSGSERPLLRVTMSAKASRMPTMAIAIGFAPFDGGRCALSTLEP